MEKITFELIGETPLLTHNNRLANPLDIYSQEMSKKTGKRKKTIEDIWELARIEWEGGLYLNDGEVQIPMRVVNKTLERGATKQKNGTLWKTGCFIQEDFHPLKYSGIKIKSNGGIGNVPNPDFDDGFKKHMFQAMVRIGQSTLLRTRPIFNEWSLIATILFEPSIINPESIIQCVKDAGRLVGMGDWRIEKGGSYGRFSFEVIE